MTSLAKKMTDTTGKRRWQALILAGMVLVGGSVAVPQAADAAPMSTRSQTCGMSSNDCVVTIKMTKTGASARSLYFKTTGFGNHDYALRTSSGKRLCSGRIQGAWGEWKRCVVSNRSTTLYLSVSHNGWGQQKVDVRLY